MLQVAYIVRRPRKLWELTVFTICASTGAHLADGGPLQFCDKASALAYCAEHSLDAQVLPSLRNVA